MPLRLILSLKKVWYEDWVKLWGKVQLISGAILASISQINSYITDPTFKSYLEMFDVPKSVLIAIAVVGLITWLSGGREKDV